MNCSARFLGARLIEPIDRSEYIALRERRIGRRSLQISLQGFPLYLSGIVAQEYVQANLCPEQSPTGYWDKLPTDYKPVRASMSAWIADQASSTTDPNLHCKYRLEGKMHIAPHRQRWTANAEQKLIEHFLNLARTGHWSGTGSDQWLFLNPDDRERLTVTALDLNRRTTKSSAPKKADIPKEPFWAGLPFKDFQSLTEVKVLSGLPYPGWYAEKVGANGVRRTLYLGRVLPAQTKFGGPLFGTHAYQWMEIIKGHIAAALDAEREKAVTIATKEARQLKGAAWRVRARERFAKQRVEQSFDDIDTLYHV